MAGVHYKRDRSGLFPLLMGATVGLIVGAALASAYFLVVWRPQEILQEAEQKLAPQNLLPPHPRLPTEEVLEYLEGKSLPLPDGPGAEEKAKKNPVIHRRGVKQLIWERTASIGGSNIHHHDYALLYDAGDAHYVAEVHIDVRQVGDTRAYLGFQATDVRKADKIVDAPPN